MTTVLVFEDDDLVARLLASVASGPTRVEVVRCGVAEPTAAACGGCNAGMVTAEASCAAVAPNGPAFRLEGEYWTIGDAGNAINLRDSKGLRYVAYLLRHPGRGVPAYDLVAAINGDTPGGVGAFAASQSGEAATDARARRAYRQRWAELVREVAEAEARNDLGRLACGRAEMERLAQYLSATCGLGGRSRRLPVAFERAGQTVTKGIRNAVGRIRRGDARLGRYLATHIKTGHVCTYEPESGAPVGWRF
jgi:hypothetical protein